MKKLLFLIMLLLSLPAAMAEPSCGSAPNEEMRKEFREFKLKYLAQEMELTAEQQKKFFPLYNQMSEEKRKVFHAARALEKSVKNDKAATDADFERVSKAKADAKIKEGEIERKYNEAFSKFLSPKQIYKMKEAEETFRTKMHQMRKAKKGKK